MAAPVEKRGLLDQSEPDSPPDADSALAGVITSDLPCRTCGYNLRGLADGGRCPECDTPIDRSQRGDLLRYSEPRWVRTIARGFRVLNVAIALGLIAVIALSILARPIGLPWLMMATALAVGGLAIVGVWLATEREPAAAELESPFSNRRLLRALVIAALALQVGNEFLVMRWTGGRVTMRLIAAGVLIAGMLCAFRYALSLARRIPDPALILHTRGVMWGVIVSYALFLSITALAWGNPRLPPVLAMVFGLSCTVFVACIMFTLWCVTLIGRYAEALSAAAFDAEAVSLGNAETPS